MPDIGLGPALQDTGGAVADLFGAQGSAASAASYAEAATLAGQNAQLTRSSTAITEMQDTRQIYQALGTQQADLGGAGIGGGADAQYLLRSSQSQGALTKAAAAEQGLITENAYAEQQGLYNGLSKAASATSTAQTIGGVLQAGGAVVNGVSALTGSSPGSLVSSAVSGVKNLLGVGGTGEPITTAGQQTSTQIDLATGTNTKSGADLYTGSGGSGGGSTAADVSAGQDTTYATGENAVDSANFATLDAGVSDTGSAAASVGAGAGATDAGVDAAAAADAGLTSAGDVAAAGAGALDAGVADAGVDTAVAADEGLAAAGDAAAGGAGIMDGIAAIATAWVVCTELHKQGRMPTLWYIHGARRFAQYDEEGKRGYYLWAVPATIHLRAHPDSRLSKVLEWIFLNRAEYISAQAGARGARKTLAGWATVAGLYALCRGISWFIPKHIDWTVLYKDEI
jgi:hypothetical protein